MLTVQTIARAYRVEIFDFERGDDWLLVASGCGILMSIMDVEPRFRWCIEVDAWKESHRLHDLLIWLERLTKRIAIAGWFSISDPEPFRLAVASLKTKPLCYTPPVSIGGDKCESLAEFLARL